MKRLIALVAIVALLTGFSATVLANPPMYDFNEEYPGSPPPVETTGLDAGLAPTFDDLLKTGMDGSASLTAIDDLGQKTAAIQAVWSKPETVMLLNQLRQAGFTFATGPTEQANFSDIATAELTDAVNPAVSVSLISLYPKTSPPGKTAVAVVVAGSDGVERYIAHSTNASPQAVYTSLDATTFYVDVWEIVNVNFLRPIHWCYWWFDGYRHVNWYYSWYRWFFFYRLMHHLPWPWWYNWFHHWYFWHHWWYWCRYWPY